MSLAEMGEIAMADDQDTVAEAGWIGALRDTWRKAERLTVMTALAFLASTLVNTLIFDRWGQTFLAIATPTDVVMSGLRLAITPAIMGLAYAGAYAGVLSRRTWGGANIFLLLTVVGLGIIVAGPVGYGPAVLRLWWATAILGWFTGGLVALGEWSDRRALKEPPKGFWRGVARWFKNLWRRTQYGVLIVVYLFFCGGTVWITSEAGYFSSLLRLHKDNMPANCAGRVLWTGERAVLIDCGQFPAHDVQVLYGADGLRIIKDDRHWPNPAPPKLINDFGAWLVKWPPAREIADAMARPAKPAPEAAAAR